MFKSSERSVPTISTSSGMMLLRTPPRMIPIVTMDGASVDSICRLGMVCNPRTICDAITMGSMPSHGYAPCVCFPWTTMRSESTAAIAPPGR